jgi:hypothetical protein
LEIARFGDDGLVAGWSSMIIATAMPPQPESSETSRGTDGIGNAAGI